MRWKMGIYYINLERSPDRRAYMEAQFDRLGLDCARVAAVDALTAPLPDDARWRGFRPTETACFLSHLECWRRIAADTCDFGVVFEDDVTLADSAAAFLTSDWRLPPGIDLLKLETTRHHVRASVKAGLCAGFGYRRLYNFHLGAAAYALTRSAAARLLGLAERALLEPVDIFLFSPVGAVNRQAALAQLDPAICMQARLLGDERFPTTISYSEQFARRIGRRERAIRELYKLGARIADRFDRAQRETVRIPFAND